MAVLKKGSKGSAVKDLQTKLNKAKTKPELKVDGIFGPLTDKAVRVYQKKNGLKVDGKVGEYTLATIKYGGELPEMMVDDYQAKKAEFSKVFDFNRLNIASYVAMEKAIAKLSEIASKEVPNAKTMNLENRKYWTEIADFVDLIISRQSEFKTELTKNPAKAKKLAMECEKIHKHIKSIGKTKILPNIKKAAASLEIVQKKTISTVGTLKSERAAIDKRKEEF